eukprot:scaffold4097_cov166-Amphora_coffeaeformis.AAC.17
MNFSKFFSKSADSLPIRTVSSCSFLSRRFSAAVPKNSPRPQKSKSPFMPRTFVSASSSPPKARVLVLGIGRMGQIRCSLLRGNPRFDVRGVVDTNLTTARTLADKYGVSDTSTDHNNVE